MKAAKAVRDLRPVSKLSTDFDKVGKYDQNAVNGFDRGTIDSFLDLVGLESCSTVLDAMAGDGNLTERVFQYCAERGLRPPKMVTLELSAKQCAFAADRFKGQGVQVIHGDVLSMKDLETGAVLPDNHFDAIMLKSGNHELPLEKQRELYQSLFRVLRPGGKLVHLGIVFDDEEERGEFSEILRVKDTLAGLEEAARNRYFLTRKEFYPMLREAGFADVTCGRHLSYIGRTSVVSDVYFKSERDRKKVEFERALMGAVRLRQKFQVFTLGDDSIYVFPGEMTVATKPRLALVR